MDIINNPDIKVLSFNKRQSNLIINKFKITGNKNSAVLVSISPISKLVDDNSNVLYEMPFYKVKGKGELGISHLFYVRLFDANDHEKLKLPLHLAASDAETN